MQLDASNGKPVSRAVVSPARIHITCRIRARQDGSADFKIYLLARSSQLLRYSDRPQVIGTAILISLVLIGCMTLGVVATARMRARQMELKWRQNARRKLLPRFSIPPFAFSALATSNEKTGRRALYDGAHLIL